MCERETCFRICQTECFFSAVWEFVLDMSVIVTVYGNYPYERTPIAFGPNIVFWGILRG